MLARIATRLAREESGFTMIELLLVSLIIGILTSISVPTLLAFQSRANKGVASTNIEIVTRDIERYDVSNFPGAATAQDPNWNGSDAVGVGTNNDSGYADTWAGAGHDVVSLIRAKYDTSVVVANYHFDPAGWAPAAGLTTSTDYCVYTAVGVWYGARHGPNGAITTGKTMHLGGAPNGDCYAS